MAAVTTMAIATYVAADKQADAAKSASKKQAKGVTAAQQMQREFTGKAVDQLGTNYDAARQALLEGQNQSGLLLDQSGNILSGGYDQARSEVNAGYGNADRLLSQGFGDAINTLNPAYQQGQQSGNLQAALSGALGADAQREAYANFTDSPGQEFLRNRQEQAILRNATALGGGLGAQPAVMQQLQESALGMAQQDFGNAYDRLSQVTNRGDMAGASIANLQSTLGASRSGIQQQLAQILSGLSTGKAGALAGINTDKANMTANAQQGLAQLFANQGTATSNAYMGAGSEQAQLAQNLGQANSAYDIYKAQNAPAWSQALTAGAGAYSGGYGQGLANMFSGGGAGTRQSDYTGDAYKNFVANQYAQQR